MIHVQLSSGYVKRGAVLFKFGFPVLCKTVDESTVVLSLQDVTVRCCAFEGGRSTFVLRAWRSKVRANR